MKKFKHVKIPGIHCISELNLFAKDINVSVKNISLSNYITFESFPQNLPFDERKRKEQLFKVKVF